MDYLQRQAGVTLTELLVVSAISALVILAISAFVIGVYDLPAFQLEQGRITTDLRVQMERMSDDIRAGRIIGRGSGALQLRVPNNAGGENHILYFVSGDSPLPTYRLVRWEVGVSMVTVARGVQSNQIFKYYSFGGPKAFQVMSNANPSYNEEIGRVEITLKIDTDSNQPPGAAEVKTVVHRRQQLL